MSPFLHPRRRGEDDTLEVQALAGLPIPFVCMCSNVTHVVATSVVGGLCRAIYLQTKVHSGGRDQRARHLSAPAEPTEGVVHMSPGRFSVPFADTTLVPPTYTARGMLVLDHLGFGAMMN